MRAARVSLTTVLACIALGDIAFAENPAHAPAATALEQGFVSPPAAARPRVWWHWMNGNISKEGIALDFAWMKRVGIGGIQNFDANLGTPQVVERRISFMTPEWKDAFKYAAGLAQELDLELAIAGSPGWSETGGPWVRPDQAMKKLVWSETYLTGGKRFTGALLQPPVVSGPYQQISLNNDSTPQLYADAVVLAFPIPADERVDRNSRAQVTSSAGPVDAALLTDGDVGRSVPLALDARGNAWVQFRYSAPKTVRAVTLGMLERHGFGAPPQPLATLQVSDDGVVFHPVADLEPTRASVRTVSFPETSGTYFRLQFSPGAAVIRAIGPGVQPVAFGSASREIPVTEFKLHARTQVNHYVEKAGFAPAVDYYAIPTTDAQTGSVVAKSRVVDVTAHMQPDGRLDWTPPAGDWIVLRYGYSLTGHTNGPASPEATGLEVDKLNRQHVKDYLDHYLGMYADTLGPDLIGQRGLRALLTDSYEAGAQNWTEDMVGEFTRRRGYDPRPWMPAMSGWIVESAGASDRFLWDFRRTLAEMLADVHYRQVKQSAAERGLKLYGEALEDQRPALGDDMEMRRYADIPMAAMWTYPGQAGPSPTYVADHRGAASVAHIYGQNLAAAESLTAYGWPWAFAPRDLQPVVDLQFALGINRIVVHTSVHQPLLDHQPGLALNPMLGQYFNRNETWAEQAGPWMDYISRSSYLLQQGKFVGDIAYFYGEEAPLTGLFGNLPAPDLPAGYGFDFANADVVLNRLAVNDHWLTTTTGMRYRVLYLGGSSSRMTLGVLHKLRELVTNGATILGSKPESSPSQADDPVEFQRAATELWGPGASSTPVERVVGLGRVIVGKPVADVLAGSGLEPDFEFQGEHPDPELLFLHRSLDAGHLYFVSNRKDRSESGEAVFRIAGRAPELWHADSGKVEPLSYRIVNGRTFVPLSLRALGSVFVVFREGTTAASLVIPAPVETPVLQINGPWTVGFQPGRGAPASISLSTLASWTENSEAGVRYFSGSGTYRTIFRLSRNALSDGSRILLDLGDVRELAVVKVNGEALGTLWHSPYRIDVTDALQRGVNTLEVEVTNLWVNRLIGDMQPGATKIAFTTGPTYSAAAPLRPSGLLGPVNLVRVSR
jgi:hypothetical protein